MAASSNTKKRNTGRKFLFGHVEYQNFNYTFDWLCLHWVSIDSKQVSERTSGEKSTSYSETRTDREQINSFTLVRIKRGRFILCTCFQFFFCFLFDLFLSFTLTLSFCLPGCYSDSVCSIWLWIKNKRPFDSNFSTYL